MADGLFDAVFASPDLYALISERAFDPVRTFRARHLAEFQPIGWHDVATLASLARVNRALARAPWPAAAGVLFPLVGLGHKGEARRRRSHVPRAARAAIQAKLEAGLALVARACDALAAELCATAAPLARAPGSAAERAYRACVLYTAVDAYWRVAPSSSGGFALLPAPPPRLARALHALGASARLPAELRAAALATLVAVMLRLARLADPQCALARANPAMGRELELTGPRLDRLERGADELAGVYDSLQAAVGAPEAEAWLGPLALAMVTLLEDAPADRVIRHGLERANASDARTKLPLGAGLSEAYAPLCALFADPRAPIGARSCAAVALERHARWLHEELAGYMHIEAFGLADELIDALDDSGASALYRSLGAELARPRGGGGGGPRRGRLVMPLSRAHLLRAARQLGRAVDDDDLRAEIKMAFADSDDDSDDDDDGDDDD